MIDRIDVPQNYELWFVPTEVKPEKPEPVIGWHASQVGDDCTYWPVTGREDGGGLNSLAGDFYTDYALACQAIRQHDA